MVEACIEGTLLVADLLERCAVNREFHSRPGLLLLIVYIPKIAKGPGMPSSGTSEFVIEDAARDWYKEK